MEPTDLRGQTWIARAGEVSELWACSNVTWTGERWSVIVRRADGAYADGAYIEQTLDPSPEGIEQFVSAMQVSLDGMLVAEEETLDFSDLVGEAL